jgi:hypothetical protein
MRTWTKMGALMGLGLLAACNGGDKDSADDSAGDPDDGDTGGGETDVEPEAPTASVSWGADSIALTVSGGGGAWWFGMAESVDCDDCWTGEDCVYGYEAGDGSVFAYCHDAGDAGVSLTYGGNPSELVAGTTVFSDAGFDGKVSYILESDPEYGGDGSCWIWGADNAYYEGLLCGEL